MLRQPRADRFACAGTNGSTIGGTRRLAGRGYGLTAAALPQVDAQHCVITSMRNGKNLQCRQDNEVSFCTRNEGACPPAPLPPCTCVRVALDTRA